MGQDIRQPRSVSHDHRFSAKATNAAEISQLTFTCGHVRRTARAFEAAATASYSRMSQRGKVADWPAAGVPARHPVTTVTWVDRSDSV
jgi:hypothetical protein